MENKTLRRIFKKSLTVTSKDELKSALLEAAGSGKSEEFFSNFSEAIDAVDKAMTDLDKVIEIRDRSLAISSREMTALNEEIAAQAEKQKVVLNQLQSMLALLSAEQSENVSDASDEADLQQLIGAVDRLIKSQLNFSRSLKVLFEEGLRISSVLSFTALERQLQESIAHITGARIPAQMFFSGFLFGEQEKIVFFSCDTKDRAKDKLDMSRPDQIQGAHFVNIDSPKGNGRLAMIRLEIPDDLNADEVLTQLQPLLPNVAATLENIRLLQEEKQKQRLENELQTARFVQQTLLPSKGTESYQGVEVSGFYQSASECGGDWWTHFRMNDGRHVVIVGDVTGHGTASAMVCAVVKGYCDSFINRSNLKLSEILSELNQVVFSMSPDGRRAMTMAVMAVDPRKNEITFANAGHPHPIVLKPSTNGSGPTTNYLINSGSILGITQEADYVEKTFPFELGDQIVFYSDGLTEYVGPSQQMYGDRRLRALVGNLDPKMSAAEVNKAIIQDLKNFAAGASPEDDVTTVVVKNARALL